MRKNKCHLDGDEGGGGEDIWKEGHKPTGTWSLRCGGRCGTPGGRTAGGFSAMPAGSVQTEEPSDNPPEASSSHTLPCLSLSLHQENPWSPMLDPQSPGPCCLWLPGDYQMIPKRPQKPESGVLLIHTKGQSGTPQSRETSSAAVWLDTGPKSWLSLVAPLSPSRRKNHTCHNATRALLGRQGNATSAAPGRQGNATRTAPGRQGNATRAAPGRQGFQSLVLFFITRGLGTGVRVTCCASLTLFRTLRYGTLGK